MNAHIVLYCLLLVLTVKCQSYRNPNALDLDLDEDIKLQKIPAGRSAGRNDFDASLYYRRIIKYLFNKRWFQDADPNAEFMTANVPLRLNKKQWELLVEHDIDGLNLGEIDSLLEDVLQQSHDSTWDFSFPSTLLKEYIDRFTNSPIQIAITAIVGFISVIKVFHLSKLKMSGLLLLVLSFFCAYSLIRDFNECNDDLQVDQVIHLDNENSDHNPCQLYRKEKHSKYLSFMATYSGSYKKECDEHRRKLLKSSLQTCDPLVVFAQWIGKIQMSYFGSILKHFLDIISDYADSENIFKRSLLYLIGAVFFILLIALFGVTSIKHFFNGLFRTVNSTPTATDTSHQTRDSSVDYHLLSSKMDALLLENQHMKRELSVIRELSVERVISNEPNSTFTSQLPPISQGSPRKKPNLSLAGAGDE